MLRYTKRWQLGLTNQMFEFLSKSDILALQSLMVDRFGGIHGIRDEGGLESALNAAQNRAYYEGADIQTCAATYTYHLCKAHAFLDGNKRIAAIAAESFLELNGFRLNLNNEQLIELILSIASGEMSRDEVEETFHQYSVSTF